jgi:hypothetical protein
MFDLDALRRIKTKTAARLRKEAVEFKQKVLQDRRNQVVHRSALFTSVILP